MGYHHQHHQHQHRQHQHHSPDGTDSSATYGRLDDDRSCYKPRNRQPYPQYHRGPPPPPNPSNRPRGHADRDGSAEFSKHRLRLAAQERSSSVPPKKRHRWDNPGYVKGPGSAGIKASEARRRSTPFSRHHGPAASSGCPTTVGRAGRTVSTDTVATSEQQPAEETTQPKFATFLPPTVADDSSDGECQPSDSDGRRAAVWRRMDGVSVADTTRAESPTATRPDTDKKPERQRGEGRVRMSPAAARPRSAERNAQERAGSSKKRDVVADKKDGDARTASWVASSPPGDIVPFEVQKQAKPNMERRTATGTKRRKSEETAAAAKEQPGQHNEAVQRKRMRQFVTFQLPCRNLPVQEQAPSAHDYRTRAEISKAGDNEARKTNELVSKDAAAKVQQTVVQVKSRCEVGMKEEQSSAPKCEARTAKNQSQGQFVTFLPPTKGDSEPASLNQLDTDTAVRQSRASRIKTDPVPAETHKIATEEKKRMSIELTAQAKTSQTTTDSASVPLTEGRVPKKEDNRKSTDSVRNTVAIQIETDPAKTQQVVGRIPKRERTRQAVVKRIGLGSGIYEVNGEKTKRTVEAIPEQSKMREFVTFLPPPSVRDEEDIPVSGSKRPRDEPERFAKPDKQAKVDGAEKSSPDVVRVSQQPSMLNSNREEPLASKLATSRVRGEDVTKMSRNQLLASDGSKTPHVKSESAAHQLKCKTSSSESSIQTYATAKLPPHKAKSSAVSSTKKKANHIRIKLPKPAESKTDEPTASDRDEEVAGITDRGKQSSTRLKIKIPRAPQAEAGDASPTTAAPGKKIRIRITCSPRSGKPGMRAASAASESSESPAPWDLPRPTASLSCSRGPAVLSESSLSVPSEKPTARSRDAAREEGGDIRRDESAKSKAPRGRKVGTSLSSVIRKSSTLQHEKIERRDRSEARDDAVYDSVSDSDSDSDSSSSSSSSR